MFKMYILIQCVWLCAANIFLRVIFRLSVDRRGSPSTRANAPSPPCWEFPLLSLSSAHAQGFPLLGRLLLAAQQPQQQHSISSSSRQHTSAQIQQQISRPSILFLRAQQPRQQLPLHASTPRCIPWPCATPEHQQSVDSSVEPPALFVRSTVVTERSRAP